MASPLSPLQHATLNNIPAQPTSSPTSHPAFASDAYEVVHASSVTTTHILADATTATAKPPPFVFPLPSKKTAAAMDAPASSSPFMNSVVHTPANDDQHSSSSQENVSPHPHSHPNPKPVPSPVMTTTAPPPTTLTGRQGRPGSRILSGSELSPLKILQGRVAGGPPSSSATSTATLGSPASPDSGAESRRDIADDQASSTASSPPPTFPPPRRMSTSSNQMLPPALPLGRTPRKFTGPDKRFPVKISVPPVAAVASVVSSATASPVGPRSPMQLPAQPLVQQPVTVQQLAQQPPGSPSQPGQAMFAHIQKQQKPLHGRQMSLDEAIQLNEGLKQAIEIFEDETSVIEDGAVGSGHSEDGNTQKHRAQHQNQNRHPYQRRDSFASGGTRDTSTPDEDLAGMDDTMASTFSTFSAIPNTGMVSRHGASTNGSTNGSNSPNRTPSANGYAHRAGVSGPDAASMRTPRANGTAGAGGPLPNRMAHYEHGNTTSLLMDFTEQLRLAHNQQLSPSKGRFGPHISSPDPGAANATPQRKSLVNLLDFEIPPLPTPRSIPSVTPRELESLKSNFLSDISSLKASLSGKEAEVLALKTAVGDAEKRVGECMEQLREERGTRDLLSEEKDQWERRGREMEEVLRNVKGEIVMGHRDRDELEAKLDESEKRREAAEMMAQEAETKMAVMRAGRATADAESNKTRSPGGSTSSSGGGGGGSSSVQREVEIAVERVARELHMAYKAKHETKVTALKKSYEARWEKRVHELETVAEALAQENDKLRIGRDATLTRMVPGEDERRAEEERRQREARDAAQIKEMGAEVNKLEAVVRTVKADNAELRTLLEQERVEKGELVIMAEEMMSMQQSFIASSTSAAAAPAATGPPSSSSYASAGTPMSPRKPKTPAPARTSMSGISRPPSSAGTHRNSIIVNNGGNTNANANTNLATTTPGRAPRPMSMHGTGGRLSGLKPPSSSTMATGGVPSRIGRIGHDRKMSGSGGSLPRPPSGLGTRSGLMSSIEKMGNHRGRAE